MNWSGFWVRNSLPLPLSYKTNCAYVFRPFAILMATNRLNFQTHRLTVPFYIQECIRFITRSRGQAGTANPNDPLGRSTPTLTPAPGTLFSSCFLHRMSCFLTISHQISVSDFDPMEEQDDPYWIGVETTGYAPIPASPTTKV
mgnify:CR=1 FL=1